MVNRENNGGAVNKKNILVVTTSFPRFKGDFDGSFIFELSSRLAKNFNVFVLAPHFSGIKVKEKMSDFLLYRFRYFWPPQWQKVCGGAGILANMKKNKLLFLTLPFLFIGQFASIIYLIRKEKIDLIHAHWLLPSGITSVLAGRICGKKIIISTHGTDVVGFQEGYWGRLKKWIINQADLITVVSSVFVDQLAEECSIGKNMIKVIPMGVDVSLFRQLLELGIEGRRQLAEKIGFYPIGPILFFVGRITKDKGIRYLIEAMQSVIEKFPDSILIFIGDGTDRGYFDNLLAELKFEKNIFFLGSISNSKLVCYYNAANVFILPSLVEGLPVVLMEAMACGCPVIATEVGGIAGMIKDKNNGLLIRAGSVSDISSAVNIVLTNNDLRENIIKEAQKTIREQYDWQIICRKFRREYKKLVLNL